MYERLREWVLHFDTQMKNTIRLTVKNTIRLTVKMPVDLPLSCNQRKRGGHKESICYIEF